MQLSSILEVALQYGIFAGLFISLLIYTIRQNEKREKDYRAIIKSLNATVECVTHNVKGEVDGVRINLQAVSSDVHIIKRDVEGIKRDVGYISGTMPLVIGERRSLNRDED